MKFSIYLNRRVFVMISIHFVFVSLLIVLGLHLHCCYMIDITAEY